jgi:membrane fusion protein, heavy metal efflux system
LTTTRRISPGAPLFVAVITALIASGCERIGLHSHEQETETERGDMAITHFTERTELFVEFPQLVVGEESPFAAHVTDLADFRPLLAGEVTAVLSAPGMAALRFSSEAPRAPGIFVPVVAPVRSGLHTLAIEVRAESYAVTHELGTVMVFPDLPAALREAPEEDVEGVAFLKEQQWQVDFATAPVGPQTLRHALPAAGFLRAAPHADTLISAPAAGFVMQGDGRWPQIGDTVQRGARLAMITPRLAASRDLLSLELDRDTAAANHALARQQLERLEGLLAREAVPERSVLEAQAAVTQARAELDAAEGRLQRLRSGAGEDAGGIVLSAPVGGELIDVRTLPGAFVDEGAALFRVADTTVLWLEARVPEADFLQLARPTGAVFRLPGSTQEIEIEPGRNGRLVSVGRMVDPQTRTVTVTFEIDGTGSPLPIGALTRVRLLTGATSTGLAVPESAVVDDAGQTVVFVQLGGETFERRVIELGLRDGGYVEVVSGLAEDERIVTRGAYLVRLAAASPSEAGAGHTH